MPFTLSVVPSDMQRLKIDGRTYPVIDGKVRVAGGLTQNADLESQETIYVLQITPQTLQLLEPGFVPIHNGTHLLENFFCRTGNQIAKSNLGQCYVDTSGPLWISYEQESWFKFADVSFAERCSIAGTFEIGSSLQFQDADYCKLNNNFYPPTSCLIQEVGLIEVKLGKKGWVSPQGVVYLNQEIKCGEIQSFSIQIDKFVPSFILRDTSDQILHLYGRYFQRMEVEMNEMQGVLKKISSEHGYIELPAIRSPSNVLKVKFIYQNLLSEVELEIPIVERPFIEIQPFHVTVLQFVRIRLNNSFSEMDIWCTDLQNSNSAQVRQSADGVQFVDCPIVKGQVDGEVSLYSNTLGIFVGQNLKWHKETEARVIDVTSQLDVGFEQQLILTFDQVVAPSQIYNDVIDVRVADKDYSCIVADLNKPKEVTCPILPEKVGSFGIAIKHLKQIDDFFQQDASIQVKVLEVPKIRRIFPEVILPFQQQELKIEGKFSPETVQHVLIDGVMRLEPVFNLKGQILAQIPLLTPKAYLRVELESYQGHTSNRIYLKYRAHITNATLISKVVYQGLQGQKLKILSTNLVIAQQYLCIVEQLDFVAQLVATIDSANNGVVVCDLDQLVEQLVLEQQLAISLSYQDSNEHFFVDFAEFIRTPLLSSSTPQRVNLGMPTTITCTGLWTLTETKPLIKLNQQYIVEAEYFSPTVLTFSLPLLENTSTLITIQLSQDQGAYFSIIAEVDFTTQSVLSLFPEPIPQLIMTPALALRSKLFTVDIVGTYVNKLISCTGRLKVVNSTYANCEITINEFETVKKVQVATDLNSFIIGQLQIIDVEALDLKLARHMTSVIKTEYGLDLPWSEEHQGFLYKPYDQFEHIFATFSAQKLPVVNVESFVFALQSDIISFQGQPILIKGIGFQQTTVYCQIVPYQPPTQSTSYNKVLQNTEADTYSKWYQVDVVSDSEAYCFAPYKGRQVTLHIKGDVFLETLEARVQIVSKPKIEAVSIIQNEDLVSVKGKALRPWNLSEVLCHFYSLNELLFTSNANVTSDANLICSAPQQQNCIALSLQLSYNNGQVTTNQVNLIHPNVNNYPSVEQIQPLTLHLIDPNQTIQFKFSNYRACHKPQSLQCIFTSENTTGTLEWPIGSCLIPTSPTTQSLQILLDGHPIGQVQKNVVVYDMSLQILSISPETFVAGYSRTIKILLSKDEPVSCLFNYQFISYEVKSQLVRRELRTCEVPPMIGSYRLRILLDGSLIASQDYQTEYSIVVIQAHIPKVLNTRQLPPAIKIVFENKDSMYDGCLFFKHGFSVETSLPCTPPSYTTELQLHVKGTEVYIPTVQVEIVRPQFTHLVIQKAQNGLYQALVYVSQEWPAIKTIQCVQTVEPNQRYVSLMSSGICDLVIPSGNLTLQSGSYLTNTLQVILPKPIAQTPITQNLSVPTVDQGSAELIAQSVSLIEGSGTFFINGNNLNTADSVQLISANGDTTSRCQIASQTQVNCTFVDLQPGEYNLILNNSQTINVVVRSLQSQLQDSYLFQEQCQHSRSDLEGLPTITYSSATRITDFNGTQWSLDGPTLQTVVVLINTQNIVNQHCVRYFEAWLRNCQLTSDALIQLFLENAICNFTLLPRSQNTDQLTRPLTFSVTPSVFTCQFGLQTFQVTFSKIPAKPTHVNTFIRLTYVNQTTATFDLACNQSRNISLIDIQIENSMFTVLQIQQFQAKRLSLDLFFIGERTLEFRILVPYLDKYAVQMVNENTFKCLNQSCPEKFTIEGVTIMSLPNFDLQKTQVILLTKEVKLGFQNYIEVLNGQDNCIVGGISLPAFRTFTKGQMILQCFVQQLRQGNYDVVVDGIDIGQVEVTPRPKLINQSIHVYNQTEIEVKVEGSYDSLSCLIKRESHLVRSTPISIRNKTLNCNIAAIQPGVYSLSLGIKSHELGSNRVKLHIANRTTITSIHPAILYQITDQPSQVILEGDFGQIMANSFYFSLSSVTNTTNQRLNQPFIMSSSKILLDFNKTLHLVPPGSYSIQLWADLFNDGFLLLAQGEIRIESPVIIISYLPKHIIQSVPSQVEVVVQFSNNSVDSCFSGKQLDSLLPANFKNQSCLLAQNDTYLALGRQNQIVSKGLQVIRQSISLQKAYYQNGTVVVYGRGLNQLTRYGKGFMCSLLNLNGNLYQTVYAFSISDLQLTCRNVGEKAPTHIQLVSDDPYFLVQTSAVQVVELTNQETNNQNSWYGIMQQSELLSQKELSQKVVNFRVDGIQPRGFLHYQDQITILISLNELIRIGQTFPDCIYQRQSKQSAILYSTDSNQLHCSLDLSNLNEAVLLRDGLDLQIGDSFEVVLKFMKRPQVLGVLPFIKSLQNQPSSVELQGNNFWVLSQCVHNDVPLVTKYIDQNTLLCEGVQQVWGAWHVTNNNFFQTSNILTVEPLTLLIKDSKPRLGLQFGNNTNITVQYQSEYTDILWSNWSLWCVFEGINTTSLVKLSQNEATCSVPSSLYTGTVLLTIKATGKVLESRVVEVVHQNQLTFTYMAQISDLQLSKQVVTLKNQDKLKLIGRNFVPEVEYELCCSGNLSVALTSLSVYCFKTAFISERELEVNYEPVWREYNYFTLVVKTQANDLRWDFESVLVVLNDPLILGYQVFKLNLFKQLMVEFQVQDMLSISTPIYCEQGQTKTRGWVARSYDRYSLLRCTNLTYGIGYITVGELSFDFIVEDKFTSSIASVTPTQTIANKDHYVFQVKGTINNKMICVFSQSSRTLYSSEITDHQCDLRGLGSGDQVLKLRIYELDWNTVVYEGEITFSTQFGPHLTSVTPQKFYPQNEYSQDPVFLVLSGTGITDDCSCIFGGARNVTTRVVGKPSSQLACVVPDLSWVGLSVRGGLAAQIAIQCDSFDGVMSESVPILVLDSFKLSDRALVVQEQTPLLQITGQNLTTDLTCQLDVGGVMTETTLYTQSGKLYCDISLRKDLFVSDLQIGKLRLKATNKQNSSLLTWSNAIEVEFLGRVAIWYAGVPYLSNLDQSLQIYTSWPVQEAFCQFKTQNIDSFYYFSEFKPVSPQYGTCFLPQILIQGPISLSLRQEREGLYTYSNWIDMNLIFEPYIFSVWPIYALANESNNIDVYGANIQTGSKVTFGTNIQILLTVVSPIQASFITPKKPAGTYKVSLFNDLHIVLIDRPQLTLAMPKSISIQQTSTVTLQGNYFTSFTKCHYIDSIAQVQTVYVSSEFIQCIINTQDLTANSKQQLKVGIYVQERSMYNSNTIYVNLDSSPFVSSIYPTFVGEETREVKVVVDSESGSFFEFCVANRTTVVPVVRNELAQPQLCSTGSSQIICSTKQTIYYCSFNLRPAVYLIEVMDSQGFYTTTISGVNKLEVIPKPTLLSVRVPALPLDQSTLVEIQGQNFSSGYSYKCLMSKKFCKITQYTNAVRNSQQALSCQIPQSWMSIDRQFVVLKVLMNKTNSEYVIWESLNFLVYPPPKIVQIKPNIGLLSGGTQVILHGSGLDQTLGGIYAKFDQTSVKCQSIVQLLTIMCISPAQTTAGTVFISISINNQENFLASTDAKFTYLQQNLVVTSLLPSSQNMLAQQTIEVNGSGFPASATQVAYCKFVYSDGTVYQSAGRVQSRTRLYCTPRPYFLVDNTTNLHLSFNGQQFQKVSSNLVIQADPRPKLIIPQLNVQSNSLFAQVMQFQAIANLCPLVQIGTGSRFQAKITTSFRKDIFVSIRIPAANLTTLPPLTKAQFASQLVETYPINQTSQFFSVQGLQFVYLNLDELLPSVQVYQQIYGIYSWLQVQVPALPNCGIVCSLGVTIRMYYDPQYINISPSSQNSILSCQVGTQFTQDYLSRNSSMNVECITPYYLEVSQPEDLFPQIQLLSISPSFAFMDETYIKVYATVTPIYNLTSLTCKFHDVKVKGIYQTVSGVPKMLCILPSFIFLKVQSQGLPSDNLLNFEVSLDGNKLSSSGTKFQILSVDQFVEFQPRVGPDTGGTIITITILNFPMVNNENPRAVCQFPGYELDGSLANSTAVNLNSTSFTCKTPPLNLSSVALASGDILINDIYAFAKVKLVMLDRRIVYKLNYVYLRNVTITEYSPKNVWFHSPDTSRRVLVFGQHFLPLTENIMCQLQFSNMNVSFVGSYVNNYTMECNIPAPPQEPLTAPIAVPLKVSFNNGQQYVQNKVNFYYSPQDRITRIYPYRQYVKGNVKMKAFTSYFFDKSSSVAVCRFQYTQSDGTVSWALNNIIEYDDEGVICYITPALRISQELYNNGGQVSVSVSSNGEDFSNSLPFTFLLNVTVTDVFPNFVPVNASEPSIVKINGSNFVNASDTGLTSVKLTKILVGRDDQTPRQILVPASYDGIGVSFVFPFNFFTDKDWVTVELTFDQITYTLAETGRILVYRLVTLTQVRPKYSYRQTTGLDIFVLAGKLEDPQKGGDIINTEAFGLLTCRFRDTNNQSYVQHTKAYVVNQTLAGCPIAMVQQATTIVVDLSIDGGVKYSTNTQIIYVIDPPEIVNLNNTQYFYTLNESVFIKLTGYYFTASGSMTVTVDNQTSQCVFAPLTNVLQLSTLQACIFKMPKQLKPGQYQIRVSTDGLIYLPPKDTWYIEVMSCPKGYTCSQEVATVCPRGRYCPYSPETVQEDIIEPIPCAPGTYQDQLGQNSCKLCPYNFFCPLVGLVFPQACPGGWLCLGTGLFNLDQLKECPEGYYCPFGSMNLSPTSLYDDQNMKPCPDGYYCPKGSQDFKSIYGNYSTPQVCKDGFICAQNIFYQSRDDQQGATTQFGIEQCQPGFYCQKGKSIKCPPGHYCPEVGLPAPEPCNSGFFSSNSSQKQCDLCPYGTFCFFQKMSKPIQCKPGFTCQLSGGSFASQLCPAGSFCPKAVVTNITNSTISMRQRPVLCYASTYCLAGAYTPFNDSSNPQAAQLCIAGTFCEAGSNSPEGKGKCQAGYYCPENTFEQLPTQPGFFAEGTGNVEPEKCRPGTYQNETQQESCKDCELGHFCPSQQLEKPQPCRPGQFAQVKGLTQCANCPLGTYNDLTGLILQKSCKPCQPGYICANTGLTKMQDAQSCQEGYFCWYGTTTTIMLSNRVDKGYYGEKECTGLPRFFLCNPGKYCPGGTAASKVNQLECIQNYFCPLGTAAQLAVTGGYQPGVEQIDKEILIKEIRQYISSTEVYIKEFELQNKNNILVNQRDQLRERVKSGEPVKPDTTRMSEKDRRLATENYEKAKEEYDRNLLNFTQLDWSIVKYNKNVTIIKERRDYLQNKLLRNDTCDQDKELPGELIASYFQKGKNLKCPRGTYSDRSSWCIGQCMIQTGNQETVNRLNAVVRVRDVTSLYYDDPDYNFNVASPNGRLLAYNKTIDTSQFSRNYSINSLGFNDTIFEQTIAPLGIAKIHFNFTKLPSKMKYNSFFAIQIFNEENREYMLPYYFDTANDKVTNKTQNLIIRIFNTQQTDQKFKVQISLYHALFLPYLEILSQSITIEMMQAQRQLRGTNYTYGVVLSEFQMYGITLPYNAINYGQDPNLWFDFVATGPEIKLTSRRLDKDVFDSTYWQSKQINAIVFPWIPFFSNCDGHDNRIIFYDAFEYSPPQNDSYCELPKYKDLRVVNPLPTAGLTPVSDKCALTLQCRYDEDLSQLTSQTTRWFEIQQDTALFYVTERPIDIESFWKLDNSGSQTFFADLISDGSDQLITVNLIPTVGQQGIPRKVQVDVMYYFKTTDEKTIQSMTIYLLDYDGIDRKGLTRNQIPIDYTLKLNYFALDYFSLIDNFQFTVPIYILLFSITAFVVFCGIFIAWLVTLTCNRSKNPPALRFFQIARVTATSPLIGGLLAGIPVSMVILTLKYFQGSSLFANEPGNWQNIGFDISVTDAINIKRGRVGFGFVMFGFVFLYFGSLSIINKPTESEERDILDNKRKNKMIEKLEMSIDDNDDSFLEDDELKKDEVINIRKALDWKRRHFFVVCVCVSLFLMVKMEYSYAEFMQDNIQYLLAVYMFIDIISEQILVRALMEEALLAAPVLTCFTVTEFIMTMGANDLKQFIFSYFAEQSLQFCNRVYIGPLVERIEAWAQVLTIKLSQRFEFCRSFFKHILIRQLASQLQLMSLNEFNAKKKMRLDEDPEYVSQHFEFQAEKGEGLEALLGSTMGYGSQTSSMFMVPFVLMIITMFANETKIPQSYIIRLADLWIFFTFTVVVILPQLCQDVFTLHVLELTHGYKTFDYFTYCGYKNSVRTKRWLNQHNLDKSIKHDFRSLDGFCFSSQFYYVSSISSWGIIFIYFGFTIFLRTQFNPFADPTINYWVFGIPVASYIVKRVLSFISLKVGLWKVTGEDRITVDIGILNRLDQANNIQRLVENVVTNPFRQKFVMVNREWLISNLALILGGRGYNQEAGSELGYLKNIYQTAVNAEAIQARLQKKQLKLRLKQQMLPYNQRGGFDLRVDVSEDSVSDVPRQDWELPEALSKVHCYRIAKMWLDFARQQLRLKFMVADIVNVQVRRKCQKCESKFRLQVIQKIDFNVLAAKFREQCEGLAFSKARWRQFYKRRQIFVTLCMECAYIETLKAAQLRQRDPDLQKLVVQNALKQVGQTDAMVAKKLKQKSVRLIAYRWLWIARGSLLHVEDPKAQIKREHRQRLLAMNVSSRFLLSDSDESSQKEDSTLGHF